MKLKPSVPGFTILQYVRMFVHSSSVHAFVILSVRLMTDRGGDGGEGGYLGEHMEQ